MGCGCKKKKTENVVQPPVVQSNGLQNESVQTENENKIVDLIIEKLKSIEEEQSNPTE